MAIKSPYFRKKGKRSAPSPTTSVSSSAATASKSSRKKSPSRRSCYFDRSPLSCYGSIDRLGPLIFTLSSVEEEEKAKTNKPTLLPYCSRNSSCNCCTFIINDVLSKFYQCEYFRSKWEEQDPQPSSLACCWEKANLRIEECVRHLCLHRCYIRAFAPIREWIAIREELHSKTAIPIDTLLAGWKIKLSNRELEENESLFLRNGEDNNKKEGVPAAAKSPPQVAVVFLSPNGKSYSSKSEAIKAILDQHSIPYCAAHDLSSDYDDEQQQYLKPSPATTATTKCPWESPTSSLSGYTTKVDNDDEKTMIPGCTTTCTTTSTTTTVINNSGARTPLGLIEELFSDDDPWRLLISTIFLNRTSRVQVDTVLYKFLKKWPNALLASKANPDIIANVIRPLGLANKRAEGVVRFSKEYLDLLQTKQLELLKLKADEKHEVEESGLDHKKEDCTSTSNDQAIINTSSTSATTADDLQATIIIARNLSKEDILGLYQCGDYAYAAYQIFIQRDLTTEHQDHALTWYVEYQRALCRIRSSSNMQLTCSTS